MKASRKNFATARIISCSPDKNMLVKKLQLTNFRNYPEALVNFSPGRNIITGENAQGKTNLLEAIEYAARGKSHRTSSDWELIKRTSSSANLALDIVTGDYDETITVGWKTKAERLSDGRSSVERLLHINGVKKSSSRDLLGHLVAVSFNSQDLNLLRGGPKFRRDWIDDIVSILNRSYSANLARFQKSVTQKNRLLKTLFEKGRRMTVEDQSQLKVWDQQVALYGAQIIKQRVAYLYQVLPIAERYQSLMSGSSEKLSLSYDMRTSSRQSDDDDSDSAQSDMDAPPVASGALSSDDLLRIEETELQERMIATFKKSRWEEIARKQTLSGPHRDDLRLSINSLDATTYASQGQQRTLVLSLKLAELALVKEHLEEPPVLLLDDVMAELDLTRQGFLMASVDQDMQTIITTTHLDGFKDEWLQGASFITVSDGVVKEGTLCRGSA